MRKLLMGLLTIVFGLTVSTTCTAQPVEESKKASPTVSEDRVLFPKTATWPIYFVWLKQNVETQRARKAVEIASQIWNRATNKLLFLNQDTKGGRPALSFVFTYESEVVKGKQILVDPQRIVGAASLGCPTAECHLMLFIGLKDIDLIKCAVHELGHLIGLPHSENIEDIMYPSLTNLWQPSLNDVQRALEIIRYTN